MDVSSPQPVLQLGRDSATRRRQLPVVHRRGGDGIRRDHPGERVHRVDAARWLAETCARLAVLCARSHGPGDGGWRSRRLRPRGTSPSRRGGAARVGGPHRPTPARVWRTPSSPPRARERSRRHRAAARTARGRSAARAPLRVTRHGRAPRARPRHPLRSAARRGRAAVGARPTPAGTRGPAAPSASASPRSGGTCLREPPRRPTQPACRRHTTWPPAPQRRGRARASLGGRATAHQRRKQLVEAVIPSSTRHRPPR